MDDAPLPDGTEPANIRFLRRLVTVLTITMIGGLLVVVALLVIRFSATPDLALPETLTLPDGAQAQAVTLGRGWVAVVTDDDRILVYDRTTGRLRQTVEIAE